MTTTGGGGGGGGSCLAIDGSASTGSTVTSSMTISHTTAGDDRLMIVGVSMDNNNTETVTSVTYNSIALTFVGAESNSKKRTKGRRLIDTCKRHSTGNGRLRQIGTEGNVDVMRACR